jgi:hypothetical protein
MWVSIHHFNPCGESLQRRKGASNFWSMTRAYSGEVDQGSGVMPISVPVDSDQVIGAERRWQSDCVGSDRNRQEEVGSERGFGAKRR